jgi:hypothetical protein
LLRIFPALLFVSVPFAMSGVFVSASAYGNTPPIKATLDSFSVQTQRAQAACEADGATVSTAIAAYEAQNPGSLPTASDLQSKKRGGPYLLGWPYNPAYYRYSINSRGVLELAIMKSVGPPFVYSKASMYQGPQNCSGVRALAGTQVVLRAVAACEADGATVSTAMAAYEAQNPGSLPTASDLQSKKRGGPYLQGWPYNPAYYRYSINSRGVLELAVVTSSKPTSWFSAPTPYEGPRDCSFG